MGEGLLVGSAPHEGRLLVALQEARTSQPCQDLLGAHRRQAQGVPEIAGVDAMGPEQLHRRAEESGHGEVAPGSGQDASQPAPGADQDRSL